MSTDFWCSLVSELHRIEEKWKPRRPHPSIVTADHGSALFGLGILSTENSRHILPGVLHAMPGYQSYQRVSNVIYAIESAEPVAFNTIALRLGGIPLDDIRPILANILKDIALYVGGSTVVGAVIGGAVGSLAFGAGAVPGAIGGATVGAEVGNLILTFTGLKSIAIFVKDAVPAACRYYKKGFKEAWGPEDFSRKPFMMSATDDFARGHVLFIMALLMGIVAYLTRGKGNMQSLLAEVRGSARLGPKMATWLERNEDKLLNSAELRQPMRSGGGGGGGDAPAPAPASSIPPPRRGGSPPSQTAADDAAQSTSGGPKRGADGRFLSSNEGPRVFNRKTQYPSGYRSGVVDDVLDANTITEGPNAGKVLTSDGEVVARDDPSITIEHNQPVVDHWNETGYNSSRDVRNDFYNDTDNMSIRTRSANSADGGKMSADGVRYRQDVGDEYSSSSSDNGASPSGTVPDGD